MKAVEELQPGNVRMDMLDKEVVLVTGASRGIGRGCSGFSSQGNFVVVNYNGSEAKRQKKMVEAIGKSWRTGCQ